MPVIVVSNPKGGSGKSTAALVLASTLAARGASVAVVDCDPNRPAVAWGAGRDTGTLTIIGDATERRIVPIIDREAASKQFVIVDLETAASRLVSRALARADLVLVPMQASALDAAQAARAIGLVKEEEELLRRRIPYRVLFTRTNPAVKTRNEGIIVSEFKATGLPMLEQHLHQRTAYQSMFTYGLPLEALDRERVNGVDAAIANAARLTAEVVATLRTAREAAKAEAVRAEAARELAAQRAAVEVALEGTGRRRARPEPVALAA